MARATSAPPNPRELFRDLSRDEGFPFLWGHQDRILERYEEQVETPDIALELPTGTGKTLIGLLIAEWRRQALEERVLYLCPTRQLAHQVGALAEGYGITARVCLRPEYDGLIDWQQGDALAISTYSSLFNFNPRFTSPNAVILDDAHAAEGYVAGHWTVTVDRDDMADVYIQLAALLAPILDKRTADLMLDDSPSSLDRTAVELVPLPRWWPLADALRDVLEDGVEGTDQWYAWEQHVRGGLPACCLLMSWQEIVLRPLIPATRHQPEFAEATQRVYMSATLGAGGELERIFGVRRIQRLEVPAEWERHSTGRRLFLLPAASLRPAEMEDVVVDAVKRAGRALVLAPTRTAVETRVRALNEAGVATLGAGDIEESLDPFTSQGAAALVLANRYDGIDLPGEDCRLLVLDGLPVAVNALERFLFQRLSATGLLGERMRTRLTQGVGRCTRGEGDWCAVIVASRDAYDFCARGEVQSLLHPELQGELRFGLDQSRNRDATDFLDLLDVLLEHEDDWQDADREIRQLRDQADQGRDPAAEQLDRAVSHEVDFVYAMWSADFPHALERAIAVADELSGHAAAPYRAWWLYLAGTAAWLAHEQFGMNDMLPRARDLFGRAAATGRAVHWFAELAYGELGESAELDVSPDDLRAVERAHAKLRTVGFHGRGLTRRGKSLRGRLADTESTPWEEGLKQLGQLLGFEATHPSSTSDPDSVWIASERLAVVWEVKSEENPDGDIGTRTAQQASGHVAWVTEHHGLASDARILPVLVSDRRRLGQGARVHVNDARIVSLDEVRDIAEQALAALARARARGQIDDDAALRGTLVEEFSKSDLLPTQLVTRLGTCRLADLPGPA